MGTVTPATQPRLLVLCLLLWGTVVVREESPAAPADSWTSVFTAPPAYLHPRAAIGFDLSGLRPPRPGGVEAALVASTQGVVDWDTRAHTHMSLAVYYKIHGETEKAAAEKRKGDYWVRVARFVDQQKLSD